MLALKARQLKEPELMNIKIRYDNVLLCSKKSGLILKKGIFKGEGLSKLIT